MSKVIAIGQELRQGSPVDELCQSIAKHAHLTQKYGLYPYMTHLEATANLARDHKLGTDIVAACYLHDVIEDQGLTRGDLILLNVPIYVISLVELVTDEPGANRKERKLKTYAKIASSEFRADATAVKLCDRIVNVMFSRVTDRQMYKMYKKEQSDFHDYLYEPTHIRNMSLWHLLTQLIFFQC